MKNKRESFTGKFTRLSEDKDIEIRLFHGDKATVTISGLPGKMTVEIYKPGRYRCEQGYANFPVARTSTEGECLIGPSEMSVVNQCIGKAVSLMNREKEGKIRTDLFNNTSLGYSQKQTVYYGKKDSDKGSELNGLPAT